MTSDEQSLRPDAGKAPYPEDAAAPQQVAEAEAFMARHPEVTGFGLGRSEEGEACMVLFSDGIAAEKVPESLDGLPVRVERGRSFDDGA